MANYDYLKKVLNEVFGFADFRPGQLKIINQILQGNDVFAIMPTGAGKSVCFQLPAILLNGLTVVISPLIALMNDQVSRLNELKIKAVFINKTITTGQVRKIMSDAVKGLYKIVYVAPERLEVENFSEFVKVVKISLVVVDEAHCVLQWGTGFRSSYLKIAQFFEKLETRPTFAAFTATASSQAVNLISKFLKLKQPFVYGGGFERPNLFFDVAMIKNELKIKMLLKFLKFAQKGSTIVYCQTRKNVELVFLVLAKKGFKVAKYHAGLSHETRRRSQASFLADEVSVLVATNSFGMGIDKKDVRNVVHFNMPKSLEDYCQEAGRAGRDGRFSRCFLMFCENDVEINRLLIEKSYCCGNENLSNEQLLKFRKNSLNKLEQIVRYCNSEECYRTQILNYFGEAVERKNCFACGNCFKNFVDLGEIAVLVFKCAAYFQNCKLKQVEIIKILKGSWFLNKSFKKNELFGKLKKEPLKKLKLCIKELISKKFLISQKSGEVILSEKALEMVESGNGLNGFRLWARR